MAHHVELELVAVVMKLVNLIEGRGDDESSEPY
jgi:hypothetical protein